MPDDVVARLRAACTALPEVVEEAAWTGVRWKVRTRTFAHVLAVGDGWPPAYARAAATDGPAVVLMFRSAGDELEALRCGGPPFFAAPWRADEVGLVLGPDVDWSEVGELVTDSYLAVAPQVLRRAVEGAG